MSSIPGADDAAASIHAAFAKTVRYTGAGLDHDRIPAVRSPGHASGFMDGSDTVSDLKFEIRKEDLLGDPNVGDTLIEDDGAGPTWAVIDAKDLEDVDAWLVSVETPA